MRVCATQNEYTVNNLVTYVESSRTQCVIYRVCLLTISANFEEPAESVHGNAGVGYICATNLL